MDPNSLPNDFPWREAIASMPAWARQMVAMAAGVDEAVFGITDDRDTNDGDTNDGDTNDGDTEGDAQDAATEDARRTDGGDTETSPPQDATEDADTGSDQPGRGRPSQRRGASGWPFEPGGFGPGFGAGFGPGLMRTLLRGGPGPLSGPRPRASRGDVRAAILSLLLEEAMHGYQLLQEMAERSGGVWRPSPGSVYPTLAQLEDEGLVRGKKDGGRRVFTLTDEGRAAAETDTEDDAPWDSVGDRFAEQADQTIMGLREEIASTAGAVMAVATSGNPAHIARAKEMLAATRKELYHLLAED